jgi:NAD(P)H-hydrate epimerase
MVKETMPLNHATALLTVSQMGEADRLSVASGIASSVMMDKAGSAVAAEINRRWSLRNVTVLCGPGNNGGDGFVAAKRLVELGWSVRVALLGSREQLTGPALEHAQLWTGSVEPLTPKVLEGAHLLVDALFGAGLSRALAGEAATTLAAAGALALPIVAVDVPSGLMGDTGAALGAVAACLTVTFFRKKPGHVLLPGRLLCGEVVVADIGTPLSVFARVNPQSFENHPLLWLAELPQPSQTQHKYQRGHALISGGYPLTGSARMAAKAAARAGAGLTTVAVAKMAFPIYATALTSIMVHPLSKPADFNQLLSDTRFSAFLLGPGAGVGEITRSRAMAMLRSGRPTVLDADALTAFQGNPSALDEAISGVCILTPHDGEFARIFDPRGDKLTRTRAAALRSGAIIILKGCDTVITRPDGCAVINTNAPPTLATAGSGDVLSGIVLGLLAQGMQPFLAAAAGVWLHGAAAAEFGPGLLAEDLADLLPGVLQRLFKNQNQ